MNEPPQKRVSPDLVAIILLLVIGVVLFADLLFTGRHLYLTDLATYFYPTKHIVREILRSGGIPYWNPFYSAGQPMAANPEYEVFYPPQWLILLPDYHFGYYLHIIAHVWIALVGMFLFLRSMPLRVSASLYGAIAFGLGGIFLSFISASMPVFFCAAWIPTILFLSTRFFRTRSTADFCAASLAIGVQMLAGEPTALLQTWLLVGVCGVLVTARPVRAALSNALLSGALVAGGLLVGAVQILPAIGLARESVRARGFTYDLVTTWSTPFIRVFELVFPNWLGHPTVYWGHHLYPEHHVPFVSSIYSGVLMPCLVIAALFTRTRGRAVVMVVAAGSLVLAAGRHTPLFSWLYDAGANSVRYPEKFLLFGIFALIVLSAVAFDRVVGGDRAVLRMAIATASLFTTVAIIAFFASPSGWFVRVCAAAWAAPERNAAAAVEIARDDWRLAMLRGVALLLLFAWAWIRKPSTSWQAIAVLFAFVDLAPTVLEINPRFPPALTDEPPITRTLDPDRATYRIFHEAEWYGITDNARKFFSTGRGVYWVERNGLFPNFPANWGYRVVLNLDYDETSLLPTADFVDSMWRVAFSGQKEWAPIFMAMSNARYRAEYREFGSEMRRVGGDVRRAQPVDFTDVGAVPRYYFAEQVGVAPSPDAFVRQLIQKKWSRRVAFVETAAFEPSPGRVMSVRETPNTVDLDVDCEGDSLLVLSVTRHKYWSAWIDSRRASPETVNIAYQGLRLTGGRHHVRFAYRNPIVAATLPLSAFAAVLFAFAALRRPRRGATERRGPERREKNDRGRDRRRADGSAMPAESHDDL